ncbi:hypothetical protein [Solicola sp. PLA-1-18]|uniref:hypothetical protein n=1 Tax=Solicola sp. PLA-1-18 TaxID=3380532 RepID=UPI003B7AEE24
MADHQPPEVLERFTPTAGRWVGVVGLVVLALIAAAVVSAGLDRATVLVLAVVALLAVLTYAALVRPTVHARRDHLLIRNAWTSVRIPWRAVTDVDVRQTLQVSAGDKTHHAIAIGKSARKILRGNQPGAAGPGGAFGSSSSREFATRPTLEGSEVVGTDYADYVVLKVQTYASTHRSTPEPLHEAGPHDAVVRTVHWPLVVAPVALLVAVVVVALLG